MARAHVQRSEAVPYVGFSSSTLLWIPGIELGLSGLLRKHLCPLSHLPSSEHSIKDRDEACILALIFAIEWMRQIRIPGANTQFCQVYSWMPSRSLLLFLECGIFCSTHCSIPTVNTSDGGLYFRDPGPFPLGAAFSVSVSLKAPPPPGPGRVGTLGSVVTLPL